MSWKGKRILHSAYRNIYSARDGRPTGEVGTYAIINHILIPRMIVDIDSHTAQRRDFGGEFGKSIVILSVGLGDSFSDGTYGREGEGGEGNGTRKERKLQTVRERRLQT